MKKTLLILLLILCVILPTACKKQNATSNTEGSTSVPSPSQNASNTPTTSVSPTNFAIELSATSAKAGEEITVSLNFKENPSVAGYSVTVVYDPQILTFVKCENKVSGGFATSNSKTEGKVRVMCTVMGGNVLSQNGANDVLTFKINEGASGSTALELVYADSADSIFTLEEDKSMPSVPCKLSGTTVTIEQ